jgi:hypothetical protein
MPIFSEEKKSGKEKKEASCNVCVCVEKKKRETLLSLLTVGLKGG